MSNRPLRRDEASDYLFETYGIRRTRATLAKLAVTGGGPRFRKAGHAVLYEIEDLDAWANDLLTPPATTTAEHGVLARRSNLSVDCR
jgi:hypothetical protein